MEIKNSKKRYLINTNELYPIIEENGKFIIKNIKNKNNIEFTLLKGDTIDWQINILNKNSLDINIYFNNDLLKIVENTLVSNFEKELNNIIYKKMMQYQYNKIFEPINVMGHKYLGKEIKDMLNIQSFKNLNDNIKDKNIKKEDLKIKILDKIIKSNIDNKKRIEKISENYENILEKNTKYFYDLNKKSEIIENMEFKNNNLKLKNNSLSIVNKKQKDEILNLNKKINQKNKESKNTFEKKFNNVVLRKYIQRITFMNTKIIKKNKFFKKRNKSLLEINNNLKNINLSFQQKESNLLKNLNNIKVKLNKESLKKKNLDNQISIMKNNYEYELKKIKKRRKNKF